MFFASTVVILMPGIGTALPNFASDTTLIMALISMRLTGSRHSGINFPDKISFEAVVFMLKQLQQEVM